MAAASSVDIQRLFCAKMVSVSKQYVKNPNGELTLSRPKTETSVRKVSIPQEAIDLLIAEHDKHTDNPYMFPSPITGEMYYPDSIVNLHKKIWGSSKVINKWIQFRENGADPKKAKDNLFLMESIMNDMRKDLGLKRVKKGNLLGFFINDIKIVLNGK